MALRMISIKLMILLNEVTGEVSEFCEKGYYNHYQHWMRNKGNSFKQRFGYYNHFDKDYIGSKKAAD
jgi:hypothetical protein